LHPSRKIIEIIVKDAGLGPFHSPSNAPLMEKLGFQTKVQKTKPRNTKKTVWVLLDWFASLGRPSLYIGIDREQLEKILTLGFMPIPENWEQICSDHCQNESIRKISKEWEEAEDLA
jgi:hypothetical protein